MSASMHRASAASKYMLLMRCMLSQQAFNALLKTLEEPPPHVKFVLPPPNPTRYCPRLYLVANAEFRSIPSPFDCGETAGDLSGGGWYQETLEAIARMAMGGMRDAQSILDQMIFIHGKALKPEDVLDVYGLAAAHQIKDLEDAILGQDYGKILASTKSILKMGLDFWYTRFVRILRRNY